MPSAAVWHNLPSGGGLRALVAHVQALEGAGWRVEIFTPPSADRSFFDGLSTMRHHVVERSEPKAARRFDPIGPYRARMNSLDTMETHAREVARRVDAGGFDILFANSCMEFRSSAVATFSATPSVLYLQEPYRWLYEAMPELRWLTDFRGTGPTRRGRLYASMKAIATFMGDRAQARAEKRWADAHDAILVNSQFSRESVMRAYGSDSRVCYLGTDLDFIGGAKVPAREPYVLCVGAFVPEKRPDFVVEAVATTVAVGKRLVWVANVASTPLMSVVQDRARALGVQLDIEVGVSDERVREHLRRAAVLAYAPRLEPFGLVPLEAMAAGLAVVAVAEGGVRETVVDGISGVLCSLDPVAMGAAIDGLVLNHEVYAKLTASARSWVASRFTTKLAGERLLSEFSRIVS